jgi:hypothetical protein
MSAARKTSTCVTFRAEAELLARLDALIPYYSRWHCATRSDVVRGLVLASLPGVEKAAKAAKKGAPR